MVNEHESPNARVTWVIISAFLLVSAVVVSFFAALWTLDSLVSVRAHPVGNATLTGGPHGALPAEPRLEGIEQTDKIAANAPPITSLKAVRSADDRRLESYGWVDRQAGIVHVPVSVAMRLFMEDLNKQKH